MIDYFKKLPFYNKHIKKPKVKGLKNVGLLSELRFYEELNVIKTDHAFRGYAISYKVEFVVKKDPIKQLRKQTDFSNYVSDQEFENSMDLLLAIDENQSHYVYIKDFNRFICFTKRKIKT